MSRDLLSYEQHIIGGIVAGIVQPDEVPIGPTEMDELAPLLTICRKMKHNGIPIDPESLLLNIGSDDHLDFYSAEDFRSWASRPLSGSSVMDACRRLRGEGLRSAITDELEDLLTRAAESTGPVLLQRVQAIAAEYGQGFQDVRRGFRSLEELAEPALRIYEDLHKNISFAVPTGYTQLDNAILDGYSKGDFHLIAGLTGGGKSAMAWAIARRQAKLGYAAGVVSREMSAIENIMRLQASEAQLPRFFMRRGMPSGDLQKLRENMAEVRKLPIWINTETGTVEDLRIQTRAMCEEFGLAILYVDTMQLMRSREKHARKDLEVGAISRGLKEIAMENNIPVVGLSQYGRGGRKVSIYEKMDYLKESSSLEQDATTIIDIEIEKLDDSDGHRFGKTRPAKATILKNRNGSPFVGIPFDYRGEFFEFTEAY